MVPVLLQLRDLTVFVLVSLGIILPEDKDELVELITKTAQHAMLCLEGHSVAERGYMLRLRKRLAAWQVERSSRPASVATAPCAPGTPGRKLRLCCFAALAFGSVLRVQERSLGSWGAGCGLVGPRGFALGRPEALSLPFSTSGRARRRVPRGARDGGRRQAGDGTQLQAGAHLG